MKRPISNPVVILFKKRKSDAKEPTPKRGPEPCHRGSRQEGPPAIRKEVDPESIRSAWVAAFGKRLRIDEQKGFYLDGYPVTLDHLMTETNRVRKAYGMEPVGRNPKWFV